MEQRLPRFIESLNNEEIKRFFDTFGFKDYDFVKQNNIIDLIVYNQGENYEVTVTDFDAFCNDKDLAVAIAKKFRAYMSQEFGGVYAIAKKQYFLAQQEQERDL